MAYKPDPIRDPVDLFVLSQSGPEPVFDSVIRGFLEESYEIAKERLQGSELVELVSLGQSVPWLYRLTFRTRSLGQYADGSIAPAERHTIVLRLLPDYLRNVNRFATLFYVEPRDPAPFHPNIDPLRGAICLEVYPGESVLEVVQSLHDLLRWRIRELRENHALNPAACLYGRQNVAGLLDDRSLLGRKWNLEIVPTEEVR